jgi:DnaA-homolog protein
MSQLALDLLAGAPPGFGNFVAGANAEAVAALQRLADGAPEPRWVYLWGLPGCGKTHLLQALAAARPASRRLTPQSPLADFVFDDALPLYLADDVDQLDDARQQALFVLINRARATGDAAVVASGAQPPLGLALRDDLRSRLGWGLVYELSPLSDADKAQALARQAVQRGVNVHDDVIPWLLAHTSRDMRALSALLDALDRFALARQRAITLPLVREYLKG